MKEILQLPCSHFNTWIANYPLIATVCDQSPRKRWMLSLRGLQNQSATFIDWRIEKLRQLDQTAETLSQVVVAQHHVGHHAMPFHR